MFGFVAVCGLAPELILNRETLARAQQSPEADQYQTAPGAGNREAIDLSRKSPIVQSAHKFLITQAGKVRDPKLRKETLDAIANTDTCIQHRAHLTEADKTRVLQDLLNSGFVSAQDDATFPGGLRAGVFPPVIADGSACPHLPQTFFSAPGGAFGGHHSYPGGLPIHEANNEVADVNLANEYREVYGYSSGGLPTLNTQQIERQSHSDRSDIWIDQDIVLAAPIWHDWAKSIVFQWRRDGSEFQELSIGGNGATDNNGSSGDSTTGAHHILSIAESIKRGLSPAFVIAQASAHSTPANGNEFKIVNWLQAASIIARIDPVQKGYLSVDTTGHRRLPALRGLDGADLLDSVQGPATLLVEYSLHNLSDAGSSFSSPALRSAERILRQLAPSFGIDPKDLGTYNNRFRNPILSFLTAERLWIIYSEKGLTGAKAELEKLRQKKII